MKILEELRELIKSLISGIFLLVILSIFFFSFGATKVLVHGKTYILPLPATDSFTVQIFKSLEQHLLPSSVHLIVTNPISAFVAEMELSILVALLLLFPFFLYKIIKFLAPALFQHERKLLLKSLLPSVLLFFLGCVFSYYFLIPSTFKILYPYASRIGVTPFFSLEDFMSSVFILIVVTGCMFLLPIFMTLLSFLGIVKPSFWKSNLRYALLFFLIFTAVITPDGTGITMLILFSPLMGLYLLGCLLTQRFKKCNNIDVTVRSD